MTTQAKTVELSAGPIQVRDSGGSGEPVLLVHGLLVDGRLWDGVAPLLEAQGLRVIVPDMPLGSHRTAMRPDAPLSPPDVARLLGELAEALGLSGVTLVGNDTGGAICQMAAAPRPAWLGRLVLTPCDTYENFLPPLFAGWHTTRGDDDALSADLVAPFLRDKGVRRDTIKVLAGIDKADTLRAAQELRSFDRPALVMWADGDRFFKRHFAERLAADIPGARLERIDDSYAFTPIDQPERTAELIIDLIRSTPQAAAEPAARVGSSA